ncbi:MAG: hypothetical protein ACRD3W_24885, partial [Terriglobales bacterium]
DRVGSASGINNAVARIAGVLAIAVLGIVMVKSFAARLDSSLSNFPLPPAVQQELRAGGNKLAGLPVPAGLDPSATATVREFIGEAFVFGFRIVMMICAGLSLASSAVAWLMIPHDGDRSPPPPA